MKISWLLLSASLLLASSCFSVRSSGSRSAKRLFTSYYYGEGSTQYFVKPISFSDSDEDFELIVDFTFRYKDNLDSIVTVNYTIAGNSLVDDVEMLKLVSGNEEVVMSEHLRLFKDKDKNGLLSRYSTSMRLKDLNNLMDNEQWKWKLSSGKKTFVFVSNRKSRKKINSLRENLFILFE
jgi:hypothetical protein